MKTHYILGILLVVYIAQAVLSLLQIQQVYRIIEQQKQMYQGKGYTLAVGNSRSSLRSMSKGVILILVIDHGQVIQDFHLLEGFTVLSRMNQISEYTGKTIEDVSHILTTKNQKKALASAMEQICENTAC